MDDLLSTTPEGDARNHSDVVTGPPCRAPRYHAVHPVWSLLRRLLEDPLRGACLVAVTAVAVCSVLFAAAAATQTTVLSLTSLLWMIQIARLRSSGPDTSAT